MPGSAERIARAKAEGWVSSVDARREAIAEARRRGESMSAIAERMGISKQRVHQLLKLHAAKCKRGSFEYEVYLVRRGGVPYYVGMTTRGHLERFREHKQWLSGGSLTVELLARTDNKRACGLMEYEAIRIYKTSRQDGGRNTHRKKTRGLTP